MATNAPFGSTKPSTPSLSQPRWRGWLWLSLATALWVAMIGIGMFIQSP